MSTEDNVDKKATKKPAKAIKGFTNEEQGAMRERVQELKADKADGESAVLAKIGEMQAADRALAERLHVIIKVSAPALAPKLWYGMPAYARDGRSSASSNRRTSSRRGTRPSASTTARTSTKAPCGRSPSR